METRQRVGIVNIYLRGSYGGWALYAEKGHQISPTFRGDLRTALEQAKNWASTWSHWNIVVEEKDD
jgi:hypothetical protein